MRVLGKYSITKVIWDFTGFSLLQGNLLNQSDPQPKLSPTWPLAYFFVHMRPITSIYLGSTFAP